ncbi:MAG: hypothetical protein U9O83_07150 [Campylobacterota bacterium]|nr:hypothetical protein [Campylobacterota bacterium]
MNKKTILKEIDKYSNYHDRKNRKLDYFIMGINKDEAKVCEKIQKCGMQRWFTQRRALLDCLYGIKRMKKLAAYIEEWHEETQKICELFIEQEGRKKTLKEKVFGRKKNEKNEKKYIKEQDKIKVWKANITAVTFKLENKFKMMRNRLNAMPEEMVEDEINKLYPSKSSKR